jgi:adenylate kinase family enzyme
MKNRHLRMFSRTGRRGSVASNPMERIAIIGCGGSGKTTIGRRLGEQLGVTPIHLDVVFYDDDWNTLPKEKFAALQEELVAEEKWIIDGNFASTLPIRLARADTVIFLDLPAVTCLYGIAQRRVQRRLKGHSGQNDATGVYDRITWNFIKYVWGYRKSMGPRVRKLIDEHAQHADIKILTSRRAANAFLASLE